MRFRVVEEMEKSSLSEEKINIEELTKKALEITDLLPVVKLEDMLEEDLEQWKY